MKKSSPSKKQTAKKRVVWFSWQPLIIALLGLFMGVGIVAQTNHTNCRDANGNKICDKTNIGEQKDISICEEGRDQQSGSCQGEVKRYRVNNHTGEIVTTLNDQQEHSDAVSAGFSGGAPARGYHEMDAGSYVGKWIGINMKKANGDPDYNIYETKPRRIFIPHRTKEEFLRFYNATRRAGEKARDLITGDQNSTEETADGRLAHVEGSKPGIEICELDPATGYQHCIFENCGDVYVDPRDNQTYATYEVNGKCWFAEDLQYAEISESLAESILVDGNSEYMRDRDGYGDDQFYNQGGTGAPISQELKNLCEEILPGVEDYATYDLYYINVLSQGNSPNFQYTENSNESHFGTDYNEFLRQIGPILSDEYLFLECLAYTPSGDEFVSGKQLVYPTVDTDNYTGSEQLRETVPGPNYPMYVIQNRLGEDICPPGWHVPVDAEWQELEAELGVTPGEIDKANSAGGSMVDGYVSDGYETDYYDREAGTTALSTAMDLFEVGRRYVVRDFTTFSGDAIYEGDVYTFTGIVGPLREIYSGSDGSHFNINRSLIDGVYDYATNTQIKLQISQLILPSWMIWIDSLIDTARAAAYTEMIKGRIRCVQGAAEKRWETGSFGSCEWQCAGGGCNPSNGQPGEWCTPVAGSAVCYSRAANDGGGFPAYAEERDVDCYIGDYQVHPDHCRNSPLAEPDHFQNRGCTP